MLKSVYKGDDLLGEVEIYLRENNYNYQIIDEVKEIRISHFSQPSERCPPLAILHTITSCGICFKMESKTSQLQNAPLYLLYSSCITENKTAIMPLGGEELHLVAMSSRNCDRQYPCFWGIKVASGLYHSCLGMLNLRCLGIVFDLDETLIVANTMRSFEDRIEALQRKISSEVEPQRIAGMLAEVKRYQDDKTILKQYAENDQVVENERVIKIQSELVPALSENHQSIVRPIIRLHEKKIILTRINPQIRDTSVLVRFRPAWEDLRSYLTARGRKRFEVYVCTMAERDYALEMWRLLDPESNLINSKELLDRIVCVKSGLKKSLFNVFQDGMCHPKMALVIDDRLKVWDEKDQPRVHVVPAFAPYYAPQAEGNNTVPVLCFARNVACNVRGGFFKEFDDILLQKIFEISYEDDIKNIPSPPDVSNYLVSEDDGSASNGSRDSFPSDGMADIEIEKRLKEAISAASATSSSVNNLDPRLGSPLQYTITSSLGSIQPPTAPVPMMHFSNTQLPQVTSVIKPLGQVFPVESILQSSPAREEGEVPESELDPDTRRRLLILQHGQDIREQTSTEPSCPVRPPIQVSAPHVQSCGGWFAVEEEMSPRQLGRVVPKEFPLDSEPMHIEKHRPHHTSFFPKVESSIPYDRIPPENQRLPKEVCHRDRLRENNSLPYHSFTGEEMPLSRTSSSSRDTDFESGQAEPDTETSAGVLQEIAMKCGAKVEFRPALISSTKLQFSIEAWFAGEKIGSGTGRTRREAQRQAADGSLQNLANIYLSRMKPEAGSVLVNTSKFSDVGDNGFVSNTSSFGSHSLPFPIASEPSRPVDPRLEGSKNLTSTVSALKEYCMMEGLGLVFQPQPPPISNPIQMDEVYAQVEVGGQIMGKGTGLTWDEAAKQAAEKALGSLRPMCGVKQLSSPRPLQGLSSKRMKQEIPRAVQRAPSVRYPKNASLVP